MTPFRRMPFSNRRHPALRQLVELYTKAIDCCQPQLLRRLMAPNAVIDAPGRPFIGHNRIARIPLVIRRNAKLGHHVVHEQRVAVRGRRAFGITLGEVFVVSSHNGQRTTLHQGLRYDDLYVRIGKRWRFLRRKLSETFSHSTTHSES